MTLFRRLILGCAVAALAVPGFSSTIKHRAAAPPTNVTVTVRGKITDANTGKPIQGADVFAEGHKSAPTDEFGFYSINISSGRNVMVTAEHFAYNSQAKTILGVAAGGADFHLTPHPTVTVKLVGGETHQLDYASTQFAYLVDFSGYVHGDNANWCKTDGTMITPDKSEVRKITGPGTVVNSSACCQLGPVTSVNVVMKNGDAFPVNFTDSCYGYDVVFYGREPSTGQWLYYRFLDASNATPPQPGIAEIDFP